METTLCLLLYMAEEEAEKANSIEEREKRGVKSLSSAHIKHIYACGVMPLIYACIPLAWEREEALIFSYVSHPEKALSSLLTQMTASYL